MPWTGTCTHRHHQGTNDMYKTLTLLTFLALLTMPAFAEIWAGKLLDAGCVDEQQHKTAGCDATGATKAFALDVSGKIYKLDAGGNVRASVALKNRADRVADPSKPMSKEVVAKVEGIERDGTIRMESIDIQ